MVKYALVFGGKSLESDISEITYKKIKSGLEEKSVPYIGIYLDKYGTFHLCKNNKLKKGEFLRKAGESYFKVGHKKYVFDVVVPLVHGEPVENGSLGAYFDIMNIPCIYGSVLNSSLLQNKAFFKRMLNYFNIDNTKFVEIKYDEYSNIENNIMEKIKDLSYPLIVKPCSLGSSIGVNKAKDFSSLIKAIDEAFIYDKSVLIEECISSLKEVNVALLGYKNKIIVSELETVSNKDDVLSFFDKYILSKDKVTRIIPSDINTDLKNKIIEIAKNAFVKLECFGVVRMDFLLDTQNNKIYLNEINTIPGSLSYYLFEPMGINIEQQLDILYELYLDKYIDDERLSDSFIKYNKKDLLSKE